MAKDNTQTKPVQHRKVNRKEKRIVVKVPKAVFEAFHERVAAEHTTPSKLLHKAFLKHLNMD